MVDVGREVASCELLLHLYDDIHFLEVDVNSVLRAGDEQEPEKIRAIRLCSRFQVHRGQSLSDDVGAENRLWRKVSVGMIETGSSARGLE